MSLQQTDPKTYELIQGEIKRQQEGMELIPSENYASKAVIEALGSVFTNKYSEGYPGKRYYGGQDFTDQIENLAIERAKQLFGAEHVNVQPLSGAPANTAVYFAFLKPGDTVLGMDLTHGGHLTHGHPVTHIAKVFNFVRYKTTPDGLIDFHQVRQMAFEHKPKIILAGYTSYTRELEYEKFKQIADEIGALFMMDMAHIAGLVAGQAMKNPVEYCDIVTTTTHKSLRGPRGGMILCKKKYAEVIDKAVFPGLQGGPHMNNIAAMAVCFAEALKPEFKEYAKQILANAKALANSIQSLGFKLCFNGTENHMMVIDMANKGLSGKETQELLDKIGISLNKNVIPDDPRGAMDPSGIRMGTPAITSRGMKEPEMKQIAQWISQAVENKDNDEKLKELKAQVKEFCLKFPIPSV